MGALSLSTGGGTTCAVASGGGVWCWGNNTWGQVGDGTTWDRHQPVPVSGLSSGAVAVAVGTFETCALLASGAVKCWGRNDYGQLGNGTMSDSSLPVDVAGLDHGVVQLT